MSTDTLWIGGHILILVCALLIILGQVGVVWIVCSEIDKVKEMIRKEEE